MSTRFSTFQPFHCRLQINCSILLQKLQPHNESRERLVMNGKIILTFWIISMVAINCSSFGRDALFHFSAFRKPFKASSNRPFIINQRGDSSYKLFKKSLN